MPWTRLFLLLFLLSACQQEISDSPKKGKGFFKTTKSAVSVSVLRLTSQEVPLVVLEKGMTEASDQFVVKAPETSGRVAEVFTEIGQKVEQGEPLIRFEDEELRLKLEVARSQIEEAETGLEEARYRDKNRDKPVEQEELTETDAGGIDEQIAAFEALQERARNEVELFEHQIENIRINSPISGLVTKREVSTGTEVKKEESLLEVVRIDPLWFTFEVPLEVAGILKKGDSITVRFPAFKNVDFSGEILLVGAAAGAGDRVQVKLSIPNETLALKAGMEGEVTLRPPLKQKILPVPLSALVKTERSTYLYKVIGDKVKKTPIKLEEDESGESIISKGASEGDLVVVSGLEKLKNGATIEIQNSGNL